MTQIGRDAFPSTYYRPTLSTWKASINMEIIGIELNGYKGYRYCTTEMYSHGVDDKQRTDQHITLTLQSSNPKLSIRKLMLRFSCAPSIKSCAIAKFDIRARMTGRHAENTPRICERAALTVSGLARLLDSVSGASGEGDGAEVKRRIEDSSSTASACSFSAY
jgi:hypothetical protein